jgi:hypothetical protein
MERRYAYDEAVAQNRSNFISGIMDGKLNILRPTGGALSSAELEVLLSKKGFQRLGDLRTLHLKDTAAREDKNGYEYLYSLPIQSLTREKAAALQKNADEAAVKLRSLRALTPQSMWLADLAALRAALKEKP